MAANSRVDHRPPAGGRQLQVESNLDTLDSVLDQLGRLGAVHLEVYLEAQESEMRTSRSGRTRTGCPNFGGVNPVPDALDNLQARQLRQADIQEQ